MKIVTWNIRQGGKKSIRQIVDSLVSHRAELIVLTEYKNNDAGMFLISALKREGWHYMQSSLPPDKENGVLILSTYPLESYAPPFSKQHGSHRWNEVYIPSLRFFLLGVHVPNVNETYDKRFFWEHIVQYAYQKRKDRAMIIGDFNSIRRDEKKTGSFQYSNFIMKLLEDDWADAWKQIHGDNIDYSWFSHKNNGFRLDYLFLSPKLSDGLTACDFSHHERRKGFSDHSILTAELKMIH